jgi:hypothetical protein
VQIRVERVKTPSRRRKTQREAEKKKSRSTFKYDITDLSDRLLLIMNIRPKLRKMLLGKEVEQKFKLIKSIFRNRGI